MARTYDLLTESISSKSMSKRFRCGIALIGVRDVDRSGVASTRRSWNRHQSGGWVFVLSQEIIFIKLCESKLRVFYATSRTPQLGAGDTILIYHSCATVNRFLLSC